MDEQWILLKKRNYMLVKQHEEQAREDLTVHANE